MPSREDDDRREFLKTCGRFAVVTPPAMTILLSTSLTSNAIANSGAGVVNEHHEHHEDHEHHEEHEHHDRDRD